MAPSVSQMAADGGSRDAAVASAPRRLDGRVAYGTLAVLPAGAEAPTLPDSASSAACAALTALTVSEEPHPYQVGFALTALLSDLLQLPASKAIGGAPGVSADAAADLVDAAYQGLHGDSDLHQLQLLWALRAQLRACLELADCADLGAYIVKKYAPAAARARKLVPAKNQRFAELARVLALGERALYAEFDPDAMVEGESNDESGDVGPEYDSDDPYDRFFKKLESYGIPLCADDADPEDAHWD